MNSRNEVESHPAAPNFSQAPALCVDLDGTLVKSDTLVDALFTLVRLNPKAAMRCSLSLMKGKAAFKSEVARHVILNPASLPYNRPLLDHLRKEHAAGREIYLATATNEEQARKISDHLGIFTGVFASGADVNLRAETKRELLTARFPERGFDYIGNAVPDVPVLEQAKSPMLANPELGLAPLLKRLKIKIQRV